MRKVVWTPPPGLRLNQGRMNHPSFGHPLAQAHTVVTRTPDERQYMHDPVLALLPGGTLIAACTCIVRPQCLGKDDIPGTGTVSILRSRDQGRTWQTVHVQPGAQGAPFFHGGRLYLFSQPNRFDGIWFSASDNEGETWTEPVRVLDGPYWTCLPPAIVRDGTLYWAVSEQFNRIAVTACDLRKGILDPAAWRISPVVEMPLPAELDPGLFPGRIGMRCLEGNVVDVGGHLRILARPILDSQGTANIAAGFAIEDKDGKLDLRFTQFYGLPGGQCKFHIVYDEREKMFWMASNLPTNSQNLLNWSHEHFTYAPGNERRFLFLWYGLDAHNWFPAGCIAAARKTQQSFMYPSLAIDGEDLAILSRTAVDSGHLHDADQVTFHRLENFRRLALDLRPAI